MDNIQYGGRAQLQYLYLVEGILVALLSAQYIDSDRQGNAGTLKILVLRYWKCLSFQMIVRVLYVRIVLPTLVATHVGRSVRYGRLPLFCCCATSMTAQRDTHSTIWTCTILLWFSILLKPKKSPIEFSSLFKLHNHLHFVIDSSAVNSKERSHTRVIR